MAKSIYLSKKFLKGLNNLYGSVQEVRTERKISLYLELKKNRIDIVHDYGGEEGCAGVVMSLDERMVESQASIQIAILFKEVLKSSV